MRPAILLQVFLAITSLSAPSLAAAAAPQVVLLECDTLSVSPLRVHFEFGLQNSSNSGGYDVFRLVPTDGSHILSCSTTAPGTSSSTAGAPPWDAIWRFNAPTTPGQSIQSFGFVSDHGGPCFAGITYGPPFDEATSQQGLCFSCMGIEATPTQTSTWGSVKAYYR